MARGLVTLLDFAKPLEKHNLFKDGNVVKLSKVACSNSFDLQKIFSADPDCFNFFLDVLHAQFS